MKERPILFSGPMVRAILAGTKTQTRRIITPQPELAWDGRINWSCRGRSIAGGKPAELVALAPSPYGQPGDRLWVREAWQHANHGLGPYQPGTPVYHRADYLDDPHGPDGELSPEGKYRSWRPSIHMPRSACRLVLDITGVRVERLQDISEADAKAEGSAPAWLDANDNTTVHAEAPPTYRQGFARLWRDINGAGAWDANPWVWVVEFRPVSTRQQQEGGGNGD